MKKAATEEKVLTSVTAEELPVIEKTVKEFLEKLGIEATVSVEPSEVGADVLLDADDNGIIIGYHGEVLEALQLIFSLAASKKIGRFVRISVEIGEYKKNRSSYLEQLAVSAKERALEEGREVTLPNLKSWERRIVHLFLEKDDDVLSESVGEGRERTLVVRPRN